MVTSHHDIRRHKSVTAKLRRLRAAVNRVRNAGFSLSIIVDPGLRESAYAELSRLRQAVRDLEVDAMYRPLRRPSRG